MKKQSILKKNVFKLFSFLTLFALTFFISCEKDLDVVSLEKSNAPYKIKIVYGENFFKEHPEIRSELKSKPQLSSQSRMISSEYNFEIDETKVQIIETEAYDVFTFEIERDTLINTVLENYILIQHANDSIEHFIASYPYNIVNGKKVFNNEASISEITNPNLVYSARSVNEHIANPNCEWVPYFSSQTVYIPGERCGCHGNHFYGDSECDCPASPPTEGTYETVDITTWKYECYSGGGSSDNNGSNPSGSGSVGGSGSSNSNQNIITAPFGKDFNIYDNLWQSQTLLLNNLSLEQQNWWKNSSISTKNNILNYLNSNNNSNEALGFSLELIDLAILEPNQEDVNNILNLTLLFETNENNIFDDEFIESLDPYIDLGFPPPTFNPNMLSIKVFLKYKNLRILNPTWSKSKCLWESTKDIVHISLDAFGLIPVGGEIADIANGVLYTIEGDGLNATLSYASAVPVFGWISTSTKYGLKVVNVATTVSTKVKLVWKVGVGNVIEFGSRSQLRKVLNITSSNIQAHHIIPWNKRTKEIVQQASKSGNAFHINEALNGIPLSTAVHNGSHASYDAALQFKFNQFSASNPNATPDECYDFLTDLIQDVRTWIANNPNTPINNIILP